MADTTDVRPDALDRVAWPVTTPRLVLRRARPEDADSLFAYRSLPAVDRWLTQRFTDAEEWREHHADPGRLATTRRRPRSSKHTRRRPWTASVA